MFASSAPLPHLAGSSESQDKFSEFLSPLSRTSVQILINKIKQPIGKNIRLKLTGLCEFCLKNKLGFSYPLVRPVLAQ